MRKVIAATEGHILTNGEIYGKVIYLADGRDSAEFYEISMEEYNTIPEADVSHNGDVPSDEATEEDYRNALKAVGVQI